MACVRRGAERVCPAAELIDGLLGPCVFRRQRVSVCCWGRSRRSGRLPRSDRTANDGRPCPGRARLCVVRVRALSPVPRPPSATWSMRTVALGWGTRRGRLVVMVMRKGTDWAEQRSVRDKDFGFYLLSPAAGSQNRAQVAGGEIACVVPFIRLRFDSYEFGGGTGRAASAVAAGPGVPAILGRFDRVDVRRPDLVGRAAAHRRAGAARRGRVDGVPDRAAVAPQPAVRAARRGVGGPAGQAADGDDPGRPGPGGGAGHHPALLRAARADAGPDVRGDVRRGRAVGAVHRVGRHAVRVDRAAGLLRRRAVADLRQPRVLVHGRAVRRRPAGRGADGAVRGGRGRAVVPRLGGPAGRDQAGRAALVRRRRRGDGRAAVRRRAPPSSGRR